MKMPTGSPCVGSAIDEQARLPGNDVSSLAHMLAYSNSSPERFEELIRNALAANGERRSSEVQVEQFEALTLALHKELDALRRDQDAVLPGIGHAMSLFRSEARLFQIGFIIGTRRTLVVLAAVAVLQIVNLLLSAWIVRNVI
ncbi:hypothetical protein [Blastomonas fulva]|uniref:hypothetical protein n=1 Tax=Blastomonas fulva TaxID=1550728 RepID=UPI003F715084